MPRSMAASVLAAVLALQLFTTAIAIPTISVKGSKFFDSNGQQWYVKGVAYQLLPDDPLYDTSQCQRDAALMKQLGANAVRVYHVDPSLNHDGCMQALEAAGIYVFVDLDTFSSQIEQQAPQWTAAQLGAYMFVMDAFQKYDNVAGFFIGNEVINAVGPYTLAAPYIRASVADLKAYRTAQGYRAIPIGYSHADVAGLRPVLQDYLVCGDSSQAIDFFGLNCYEWCGNLDYVTSGYMLLEEQTASFPAPIFMSETGCNVPEPRTFADQNAIFTNMSQSWSGSVIYEWIQEENHYGIVTYNSDNTDALDYSAPAGGYSRSGTPTPISPDFANLKTQWATLNPTGVAMANYQPTITPLACPASTAGVWEVDPNAPLPTLGISVAIPTASALALANYGLASYTTPVLRAPGTGSSPSSTAPSSGKTSTPAASSSSVAASSKAASSVVASSAAASSIAAASSSIAASTASQVAEASSSAELIRSSLQSSAASTEAAVHASSSSIATSTGTASMSASVTAPSTTSVTTHSTSSASLASITSASSTAAAARHVCSAGAGLAGVLAAAMIL